MSQLLYKNPKSSFLAPNQLGIQQTLQHLSHINIPDQDTRAKQNTITSTLQMNHILKTRHNSPTTKQYLFQQMPNIQVPKSSNRSYEEDTKAKKTCTKHIMTSKSGQIVKHESPNINLSNPIQHKGSNTNPSKINQ